MKLITKIEWHDASKELPNERICVLVSDKYGFLGEAFYGQQSNAICESKKAWRESKIVHNGMEEELSFIPVLWAYYPESPLNSLFKNIPLCSSVELKDYFILEDDNGNQKPLEKIEEFLK